MNIFFKSLIYLFIFSILHIAYDLTHWVFLMPFCGINESIFQHLKMAFWAYLLTNLIEYLTVKDKLSGKINFWYPRLLSTVMLPWVIVLIWYLVPALYGRVKILSLDVLWAIFSTYTSGVMIGVIEKNIEKNVITISFKVIILILFIISIFIYIWFTYKLPWIDLFIDPGVL